MRKTLTLVFVLILIAMTIVTIRASLERNLFDNAHLMRDLWFQATLCDAYCGFLTFYCWLALKEKSWPARIGWFIAIMLLGNFAMATYALRQLWQLPPDAPIERLLLPDA